jgi:uncharacterized protein (TIGR02301 family)
MSERGLRFAGLKAAAFAAGFCALLGAGEPAQAQFFEFPFFRPRQPSPHFIPVYPRQRLERDFGYERPRARKPRPRPKAKAARPRRAASAAESVSAPGESGVSAAPPVAVAPPEAIPVYEPQLLRLAEILGALTHLRGLCGETDAEQWRVKMGGFIEIEARSAARKEKLAGAFNRGFRGYEMSHHACTPGARLAIGRFMGEGEKLTREIAERYNPS